MPTLGAPLDFAKLEARNLQAHQLGAAPSSPVKGQLYFNTADNTLWWWDGSAWVSARGGAAAIGDATSSTKGVIQLAGDLAGTAASPQIAPGVITDADVAAANKDGGSAVPSMRTLGVGSVQAMPGGQSLYLIAASNPSTSAITASSQKITNVATPAAGTDAANKTYVDTTPPPAHHTTHEPGGADAMAVDAVAATASLRTLAFTAQAAMRGSAKLSDIGTNNPAVGPVSMNGQQISNVADPSAATDGANKQYVDNVAQGLDAKASVKAASTPAGGNVTLSGAQTVDGVLLGAGDRVLIKNQAGPNGYQNGIYTVQAAAWTRANDMNTWAEVPGAFVFVEQGTTQAETGWVCTVDQGGTLDTTNIYFSQFSGAGEYIGGNGLTLTGTQFDVGAGTGITVAADTVGISNGGVNTGQIAAGAINLNTGAGLVSGTLAISNGGTGNTTTKAARESGLGATGRWMQNTHGAGTTISIPQSTHGLRADSGLVVQCQIAATGAVVWPDVVVAANGDVTVTFAVSQSASTIQVVIIG